MDEPAATGEQAAEGATRVQTCRAPRRSGFRPATDLAGSAGANGSLMPRARPVHARPNRVRIPPRLRRRVHRFRPRVARVFARVLPHLHGAQVRPDRGVGVSGVFGRLRQHVLGRHGGPHRRVRIGDRPRVTLPRRAHAGRVLVQGTQGLAEATAWPSRSDPSRRAGSAKADPEGLPPLVQGPGPVGARDRAHRRGRARHEGCGELHPARVLAHPLHRLGRAVGHEQERRGEVARVGIAGSVWIVGHASPLRCRGTPSRI